MARMFGTDGVRGVAGSELTIELATKLGQAGAYVLTKEQEHQATIIVGYEEWKNRSRTSYEAAAAWKYSFLSGLGGTKPLQYRNERSAAVSGWKPQDPSCQVISIFLPASESSPAPPRSLIRFSAGHRYFMCWCCS